MSHSGPLANLHMVTLTHKTNSKMKKTKTKLLCSLIFENSKNETLINLFFSSNTSLTSIEA